MKIEVVLVEMVECGFSPEKAIESELTDIVLLTKEVDWEIRHELHIRSSFDDIVEKIEKIAGIHEIEIFDEVTAFSLPAEV